MPTANNIAIGIEREFVELGTGEVVERFFFVIRTEGPVRAWVRGMKSFPSRTAALKDFQDYCAAMGWENLATEVEIDG